MVLNWMVAKLSGVSAIDEYCRDSAIAFLVKHGIENSSIEYVRGEPSNTDARFDNRIYFGRGSRNQQNVSFVLGINEDSGSVYAGAIVKYVTKDKIETFRRDWLREQRDFGLYLYIVADDRVGNLENLEPLGLRSEHSRQFQGADFNIQFFNNLKHR
jgi:hypothetical protein